LHAVLPTLCSAGFLDQRMISVHLFDLHQVLGSADDASIRFKFIHAGFECGRKQEKILRAGCDFECLSDSL
jgi:hypothetical protein